MALQQRLIAFNWHSDYVAKKILVLQNSDNTLLEITSSRSESFRKVYIFMQFTLQVKYFYLNYLIINLPMLTINIPSKLLSNFFELIEMSVKLVAYQSYKLTGGTVCCWKIMFPTLAPTCSRHCC